ncbi:MAG: hypothetical protein LBO07_05590 [Coriobacteriales bacterium]|jgi:hypothetical protein|nr:hypothetical protein [Coriobacteriales bacterium]
MKELTSKERAERFIFAKNMEQSRLFTTFNLYVATVLGILIAALCFLVGYADHDMTVEVLAFIQTAFALGGLAFAVWSTETRKHSVENTYLLQCGVLLEITGLMLCIVGLGARLLSPDLPVAAYLIPWIIYALSFFVSYHIVRARAGAHEYKVSKTVSFATLIVILIVLAFLGRTFAAGTDNILDSLSGASKGLLMVGLGGMMAFIFGVLTSITFFKNILVKRFDIDLSPLYRNS